MKDEDKNNSVPPLGVGQNEDKIEDKIEKTEEKLEKADKKAKEKPKQDVVDPFL
jgi:hypothetical protein